MTTDRALRSGRDPAWPRPQKMIYFRRGREFDAVLFDGSSASAAQIASTFRDTTYDGSRVEVGTSCGWIYAGMGCWVVRDRWTKAISVVDDRDFTGAYEVADASRPARMVSR